MRRVAVLLTALTLAGCGGNAGEPPRDADSSDDRSKLGASLVDSLRRGAPAERAEAARLLAASGSLDADAASALTDALQDQEAAVRVYAAVALARKDHSSPAILKALEEGLEDEDDEERPRAAANALGGLGRAAIPAVPALTEALAHPRGPVKRRAARALGQIVPEGEVERKVLAEALEALGKAVLDDDANLSVNALEALQHIGPAARATLPALAEAVQDSRRETRRQAVLTLGAVGPAAVPALAEALQSSDVEVRKLALEALEDFGEDARAASAAVVKTLEDQDVMVRQRAVRALRKIDPDTAKEKGLL
jgi:HEAT repeat protein